MSMLLVVLAALFGKSEERNLNADPGYKPANVVVAPIRFPEHTAAAVAHARIDRIYQRLRAVPGVRSVTVSDDVPMIDKFTVQVRPPARPDAVQPVDVYSAGPEFLSTLGVSRVRGRGFNSSGMFLVIS